MRKIHSKGNDLEDYYITLVISENCTSLSYGCIQITDGSLHIFLFHHWWWPPGETLVCRCAGCISTLYALWGCIPLGIKVLTEHLRTAASPIMRWDHCPRNPRRSGPKTKKREQRHHIHWVVVPWIHNCKHLLNDVCWTDFPIACHEQGEPRQGRVRSASTRSNEVVDPPGSISRLYLMSTEIRHIFEG